MPDLYIPPTYGHPDTVLDPQACLYTIIGVILVILWACWWGQRWLVMGDDINVVTVCRKCKKKYKGAIRAPKYMGTECEVCGRM